MYFCLTVSINVFEFKFSLVYYVLFTLNKFETYKYDMAGDSIVSQYEMMTYDLDSDRSVVIDTEHFKDQRVGIYSSRNFIYPDSDEPRRSLWLSKDSKYLYFYRQSRDWHKVDVCRADIFHLP